MRHRILLILLGCMFIHSHLVAADVNISQLQIEAQQAVNQGNYRQAVINYSRLLQQVPNDANYHAQLAKAYNTMGIIPEAKKHAELAIKQDATNQEAIFILAHLAAIRLDWQKASNYYQQLVDAYPKFAPGHLGLGSTLQKLGDEQGADQAYARYKQLIQ